MDTEGVGGSCSGLIWSDLGATRSSVLNLEVLDNHPGCRQCRGSAGLATARGWEGAGAAVGHGDWCGSSRGKEQQNLSNVKVLR